MEKASLPFVFGVAAGNIMAAWAGTGFMAVPAGTALAACVAIIVLVCTIPDSRMDFCYPLLFLVLGFFCGCNSAMLPQREWVPAAAARAADSLRGLIAAVPFRQERTGALLSALLTGDRSGLDRDTVEAFRQSGASHLLSLSGLHLGFIYLLVRRLTSIGGNFAISRLIRCILCCCLAVFYTLMTGASASTQRACLFIIIRELSTISQTRNASPGRTLQAALVIQLALAPGQIKSAGFQLSYLAMLGIIFVNPVLNGWYPESHKWDPLRKIWNSVAMSISCQLLTAPAAWFHFGTFPKYFLLTNLIAMPLTPCIMALSILTVILWGAGLYPVRLVVLDEKAADLLTGALEIIRKM